MSVVPAAKSIPVLAVEGVTKAYPGVRALNRVSFDLRRGEVHALIGENGAGKSTLIRVLSGDARPDEGTITLDGTPVSFGSPRDARRSGIVAIFQELMIVGELSVAENVFLGSEPGLGGILYSRRQAERQTAEVLRRLSGDLDIDPASPAGRLSTAERQIVEIARALVQRAPVLIMDEPTAALSDKEAAALLRIMRQLRDEGTAIVFISHRLDEVRGIADRITVLRGGERIATLEASAVADTHDLIALMVGRPMSELFPPRNAKLGDVVLEVRDLGRKGAFEEIDFTLRAGEVLGLAGLIGAGRTEAMRAIFGADVRDTGSIVKRGKPLRIRSPRDGIAAGIGYLPEDRKEQGLILSLSGTENIVMASLERHSRLGLLSWPQMRQAARAVATNLKFRGRLGDPARAASGGNQQKLVIGKWVLTSADILIFDEPTRGIDIGAKAQIFALIDELVAAGAGVLMISSEQAEIVHVCDRAYVMRGKRIVGELGRAELSEENIVRLGMHQ
jgi:ABC-type sugar transport system ATPase subunit